MRSRSRCPAAAGVGERAALDVALSTLSSPDRDLRRDVAAAGQRGARAGAAHARVPDEHAARRQVDRRSPAPLSDAGSRRATSPTKRATSRSRALIEAVRSRYEIARRWYRLKARVLGIERLADYDRMAAVTSDEKTYTYGQAQAIVSDCYTSFSPELGGLAQRFFDERHIDAPVRPGKRGGRVLRHRRARRLPVRDVQLHLPPARRADARARARPRRALRARRAAGDLPPVHAADARRDGIGVRRADRLRAAAGRGRRTPPRVSRCSPRTSRT